MTRERAYNIATGHYLTTQLTYDEFIACLYLPVIELYETLSPQDLKQEIIRLAEELET